MSDSSETLYVVRVNGKKRGNPADLDTAHSAADAEKTNRPDASVTVRPEKA